MPVEPIIFDVLGEPEGKARPRFRVVTTKKGASFASAYTPKKTRTYEERIGAAARGAMSGMELITGPVSVTVHAQFSVARSWPRKKREAALSGNELPTKKPDSDNILKAALDAMNGVVFRDDVQAVETHCVKTYGAEPKLTITVQSIERAAPLLVGAA